MSIDEADAARERDMAIFNAEREREVCKQQVDEDEERHRATGALAPRHEYENEKKRIAAEQEYVEKMAAAWASYWDGRAAYWAAQLAEREEAYKRSLGE